jgi:hypothetical protein
VRWGEGWRLARYVLYAGVRREVGARSAGLGRLRAAAVVGVGLWAGFVALLTTPQEGTLLAFALAAATVVCAVAAVRSPLWAWRLLVVLIVATPGRLPGTVAGVGLALVTGLALTAALVWFLVATWRCWWP